MRFIYCQVLDDAAWYLDQARGLPEISSARSIRDRCIRATILFSWIALEEMLDYVVHEESLNAASEKPLRARLDLTLRALKGPPVIADRFSEARKLRNRITHPRGQVEEANLSLDDARKVFDFCSGTIQAFFKCKVLWGPRDCSTAVTVRENLRSVTEKHK